MKEITSRDNRLVKLAVRLQQKNTDMKNGALLPKDFAL